MNYRIGQKDKCAKCAHPIIFTFREVWEHVYQACTWDDSGRVEYGYCNSNIGIPQEPVPCGCGIAMPKEIEDRMLGK